MRRFLLTLGLTVVLAAWVGAEDVRLPSPVEQAGLLHRNRELLETLIDGGIGLSQDAGPMGRAERCQIMAVKLKDEITSAVNQGERDRATELFRHLIRLMDSGMLPNLVGARKQVQPGSQQEPELFKLRDEALGVLTQVEGAVTGSEEDQKRLEGCRSLIKKAVQ